MRSLTVMVKLGILGGLGASLLAEFPGAIIVALVVVFFAVLYKLAQQEDKHS